jgi:methyl-accepting chemotaxis protein
VAIEVGVGGLEIRGIAPIITGGEYVGSVEFMQGLNSVVTDLSKNFQTDLVIALDNRFLDHADDLQSAPKIGKITPSRSKKMSRIKPFSLNSDPCRPI